MLKKCGKCQQVKESGDFYATSASRSGLTSYCKPCLKAHSAAYLIANRAAVMATKAAYRKRHPRDQVKNAKRRTVYRLLNPEQIRADKATRRARIRGASGHHSGRDIKVLLKKQKGKCPVCRSSLSGGFHIDHIVPLAAGGDNWPSNLQLLCAPCNLSKGAKNPLKFMQDHGLLL